MIRVHTLKVDIWMELRYVFGSVGLFVCKHCSKSYEWVAMTFYGGVWGGKRDLIEFWG